MATVVANRVEAEVKYKKWLWIFDDWDVGPRNAGSDPYFTGEKIRLETGSGPTEIVFYLDSDGKLDWAADPIWVQSGSCPDSSGCDPQITQPVVDPVAGTLTILDTPSSRGDLHYRLNFIKRGNPNQGKSWDPVIIHE